MSDYQFLSDGQADELDDDDITIRNFDRTFFNQIKPNEPQHLPVEIPFVPEVPVLVCPTCRQELRSGELVCPHCQMVLLNYGKTEQLQKNAEMKAPKAWPAGNLLVPEQRYIYLEVFGEVLPIEVQDTITIGRGSHIPTDEAPDVDLSPYGAGEFGVSRHHLRIRRRGVLLYVTDMGSTNGTLLNGRPLFAQSERLLRNGDELYLSHLRIKVTFP